MTVVDRDARRPDRPTAGPDPDKACDGNRFLPLAMTSLLAGGYRRENRILGVL